MLAAIGALVLAGAIAIYRERRVALRDLLVSARVMLSFLGDTRATLESFVSERNPAVVMLDTLPSRDVFTDIWRQHHTILARHLTPAQWERLDLAVRRVQVLLATNDGKGRVKKLLVAHCAASVAEATDVLERYTVSAGRFWQWHNPGRGAELPPSKLIPLKGVRRTAAGAADMSAQQALWVDAPEAATGPGPLTARAAEGL